MLLFQILKNNLTIEKDLSFSIEVEKKDDKFWNPLSIIFKADAIFQEITSLFLGSSWVLPETLVIP